LVATWAAGAISIQSRSTHTACFSFSKQFSLHSKGQPIAVIAWLLIEITGENLCLLLCVAVLQRPRTTYVVCLRFASLSDLRGRGAPWTITTCQQVNQKDRLILQSGSTQCLTGVLSFVLTSTTFPSFVLLWQASLAFGGEGGWSKHEYGVRPVVNAIPRCGAWFICGSLDAHCRPELPSLLLALPPLTST